MDKLLEKIYSINSEQMSEYSKHLMLGGGTRGGPVLKSGKGVRVFDIDGKSYIDCTSQSWALYMGYANEEINNVITEHIKYLSHVHQGFDTQPRFYLAAKLAELAPGDLNRISFSVSGALSIEAAMKICIKNTKNSRDFICLYDSYHGTTLGTIGSSWISTKTLGKFIGGSRFLPLTKPFIRVPNPYCYRCPLELNRSSCSIACAKVFRTTLEQGIAGNAAGFIVEPIQASGGQIILPKEYLQSIRKICDEFEVPLIYDEIQTYARIGNFFAAEYFEVIPDIIVLGKGLGAGLPISAIIISDKLEGFQPDTEELHTFANSSVAQVAAAKQIEILEEWVLENTRQIGKYLTDNLYVLQKEFPEIGDIRSLGLHIGIEFVRDPVSKEPLYEETERIRNVGIKNGIIFGLGGAHKNVLKIKPPLIINHSECDEILDLLKKSIKEVLRK